MTFDELWDATQNHRYVNINWLYEYGSNNHFLFGETDNVQLYIILKDCWVVNIETAIWTHYNYLVIDFDYNNLVANRPNILVSSDGNTYTQIGNDLESFPSIRIIGQLWSFNDGTYTYEQIKTEMERFVDHTTYTSIDAYWKSTIRSTFTCMFYNLSCEKHVVDKSSYLSLYYVGSGQLTEECDILNPSFLIQCVGGEIANYPLFTANYVYIEKFKRYYFITGITNVRNDLWRITAHVDVLYTYETDIGKQSGLFVRSGSASSEYSYLVDTMIPVCDIPYVYLEIVPFSYDDADVRDLNYDVIPQYLYNTSQYSVIVNVIEKTPTAITDTGVSALATGLPNLYRDNFSNRIIQSYVMKPSDISGLLDFVRNDDTLATYIASVISMPFLLPSSEFASATENVYLNATNTNLSGYRLVSNVSTYLRIAKFDFDDYLPVTPDYDFLKYEPYYQCEIYIAYHGWEKIPMIDLLGGTIDIYYVMDYIAGNSQVVIYNETTQRVVFSAPAYVGVKMGITTTNQREIETQKGNNAVSLALSLTGSAVSTFIGVATENPIGIIGGVMGATTSIASYLNKDAMLFDRASAQFSDGNTGLLAPQNIQLRFSVRNMLLGDGLDSDTILHNKVGYPNHTYGDLSDFSGWCQIEEIHYTPSTQTWITSPEIEEIESLAKNGIIL